MSDQIARWRSTADLDARAGAPVGKALNAACDEVERLRAELASAAEIIRAEAERDNLRAALKASAQATTEKGPG